MPDSPSAAQGAGETSGRYVMVMSDNDNCIKVLVACYSFSGNTRAVAEALREKTCGVLCQLETDKQYDKRTVVDEARQELERGRLPALRHPIPLMNAYDWILVGGPVWWYTVSTPLMTFLREADFAGKNVAAFCTHEGGVGSYFEDFKAQASNAAVHQGLDFYWQRGAGLSRASGKLDAWLDSLGLVAYSRVTV